MDGKDEETLVVCGNNFYSAICMTRDGTALVLPTVASKDSQYEIRLWRGTNLSTSHDAEDDY